MNNIDKVELLNSQLSELIEYLHSSLENEDQYSGRESIKDQIEQVKNEITRIKSKSE